jgi:hypothetical protein
MAKAGRTRSERPRADIQSYRRSLEQHRQDRLCQKYSLVEPLFAAHFPAEASEPWRINDLRNEIFHGRRAIQEAKFKGQPISEEQTVESIFLAAQFVSMQLDKFDELVDLPHAHAERWAKRLGELGEPLL